jgi:hypothetical protein
VTTAELLSQRLELILDWYQRVVNPQTGMLEYLYIPEDNRFVCENCLRDIASGDRFLRELVVAPGAVNISGSGLRAAGSQSRGLLCSSVMLLSSAMCTFVRNDAPSVFRRSQSQRASATDARSRRKRRICIGTNRADLSWPL